VENNIKLVKCDRCGHERTEEHEAGRSVLQINAVPTELSVDLCEGCFADRLAEIFLPRGLKLDRKSVDIKHVLKAGEG